MLLFIYLNYQKGFVMKRLDELEPYMRSVDNAVVK